MTTFADRVLTFYRSLRLDVKLPKGVGYMNPYQDEEAFAITRAFYKKFYNDNNQRKIILGINPGRFGGGVTGVPFTDPIKLERFCGIENDLQKKPELSADFIYAVVASLGGPEVFYGNFYISALSPLGFTLDGKNLNYYDLRDLQDAVRPFIIGCLTKQAGLGVSRTTAYCLGEGENYRYLVKLNEEIELFGSIKPLPHPRFIMQYRRKRLSEFIDLYCKTLTI